MKVAFLGNFGPSFSTESHVSAEMEILGHEVTRLQEGEVRAAEVPRLAQGHDLFWWVQTYGLAESGGTRDERAAMVAALNSMMPTVGFHLDLWAGLDREDQLAQEPFFRLRHIFSADGGHPEVFEAHGINHHYSPPAVFSRECYFGLPREELSSDIAFVGSWRGHYHRESRHRARLISFLIKNYRRRLALWPKGPAIRGSDLNALYASVKVVVGDSCMVPHFKRYVSDRVPETLGRGGFLLHPHVDGVFPELWSPGEHLVTWTADDWGELRNRIDHFLDDDEERERIRFDGHEHTKAHHTYAHRVEAILGVVFTEEKVA